MSDNPENDHVEEEIASGPSDDDIIEGMISGRTQKKVTDIDHLEDAIVDGVLQLKVGDTIVIERWYSSNEKRYWMGTNTYDIKEIHENGDMKLSDLANLQAAMTNWKTAPERGWRFKSTKKISARDVKQKRGKKA